MTSSPAMTPGRGPADDGPADARRYYSRVLARATKDTRQFARYQIATNAVLIALAAIVGGALGLQENNLGPFLGAAIGIAIAWCGVFLWNLVMAPARLSSEQEKAIQNLSAEKMARERRKAVRRGIGQLLTEGRGYLVIFGQPDKDRIADWTSRCEVYLTETLGPEYTALFNTTMGAQVSLPAGAENVRIHIKNSWFHVQFRLLRLAEIMNGIPDE